MLDLRNIGSRLKYCDVYLLYAAEDVDGNAHRVKPESKPLARFHSRDVENFRYERVTINGVLTTALQYRGKIETLDDLSMARIGMYCKAEDGTLYIIEAPLVTDNNSAVTALSKRPSIKYVFTLRGVGK